MKGAGLCDYAILLINSSTMSCNLTFLAARPALALFRIQDNIVKKQRGCNTNRIIAEPGPFYFYFTVALKNWRCLESACMHITIFTLQKSRFGRCLESVV